MTKKLRQIVIEFYPTILGRKGVRTRLFHQGCLICNVYWFMLQKYFNFCDRSLFLFQHLDWRGRHWVRHLQHAGMFDLLSPDRAGWVQGLARDIAYNLPAPANLMLGVTLRWTSIPCLGRGNTRLVLDCSQPSMFSYFIVERAGERTGHQNKTG